MQNDVDFGLIIRISGQKTALKRAYLPLVFGIVVALGQ